MTETQRLTKRIASTNARISRTHGQYQRTELYGLLSQLRGQLAYLATQQADGDDEFPFPNDAV